MTVDDYVLSLGENHTPTILNLYVDAAHLEDSPNESLNCQIAATKAAGAILMLTIEPWDGLHTIDSVVTTYLARLCRDINDAGVGVFVRFAHEMNGGWYPWGARPGEYRDTYRAVAAAVKAAAENTAMVWAPNTGMGYPYNGAGKYLPTDTEGSRFKQMDTNRDGVLDRDDDPFAPYYPGDDVVDWIGVSLYSKRNNRESDDEANKAAERGLLNKYINNPGTEYNLYELYAKEKNKPLMIAETASAFYPDFPEGDGEVAIKRQWWRQFWSPETLNEYPLLKVRPPSLPSSQDLSLTMKRQPCGSNSLKLPTPVRSATTPSRAKRRSLMHFSKTRGKRTPSPFSTARRRTYPAGQVDVRAPSQVTTMEMENRTRRRAWRRV